jgi:putative colanic acid biosynthesis glycosyltransferase
MTSEVRDGEAGTEARAVTRVPRVLALAMADAGSGSAAVAARVHRGLLAAGGASTLVVQRRVGEAPGVVQLRRGTASRVRHAIARGAESVTGLHLVFHSRSPGEAFDERLAAADVLHLHSIQDDLVDPAALVAWSRRMPVVWTLHDLWAATGKCSFPRDCDR